MISPHGHVDPQILLENESFHDPTSLLITSDHYVTRLLHASGVDLAALGVGRGPLDEAAARVAWRALCSHWEVFRGTVVRDWLHAELTEVFGVELRPLAQTADQIYDHLAGCLADDAFRPRALYERFGISVLATTDDPCSDLSAHRVLGADPTWQGRVIPTFRPDPYLEPAGGDWPELMQCLAESADLDTGDYHGYVAALEARRRFFVAHGATSADHSHADVRTDRLGEAEAVRIYRQAIGGTVTAGEAVAFRRHMLDEMARMSCDDGLVMTLHPGVRRDHHRLTAAQFGPDAGCDIPIRVEFTDALRPLLERYGTNPNLHLIVFTLDDTVWSRELAPLAGFYPSMYLGVPWWFLDAPDAMRRFRRAVTDTVGFTRTSGFVDDTRAFCSIPARHDLSRRIDAGMLAELVVDGRLDVDEAYETATMLVVAQPTRVFKL